MHELTLPAVTLEAGLRWLDLLGVLAFSLSGALLTIRKRFDLFLTSSVCWCWAA